MLELTQRLFRNRALVGTLVARELKARYRGSVLGFLWSLVNPLVLLVVYTFVFRYIFQPKFGEGADPYALFLMCGLFPWIWVATSWQEGVVSLTTNAGLIRKAVFPAEVLPTVSVLSNLVHFVFALPVLLVALAVGRYLGFPVGGPGALLAPFVIALQFLMVGGVTLALSALNVHFKDVKDIVNNVLALLFYLTPVIYPLSMLRDLDIPYLHGIVYWVNPVSPFTVAYQRVFFDGVAPALDLWLHMAAWSVAAWIVGAWVFDRLSDSLAEAA